MSDSEQRQLHVPYREYNSHNSTNPVTLIETDALVDLSVTQSGNVILANGEPVTLLPEVEFAPNLSTDQTLVIESPAMDRENQPLLGRLELDVTFNRFPGTYNISLIINTNEMHECIMDKINA
jgi:phosphatidylinositol 4-kinase type 2